MHVPQFRLYLWKTTGDSYLKRGNSSLISDKTKGNMRKWGCKKNQLIFFPLPAFWDLCTAHPSLPCLDNGGEVESVHSYPSSSGWGYGNAKCSCACCPECETISSWWLLCLSLGWNDSVFVRRLSEQTHFIQWKLFGVLSSASLCWSVQCRSRWGVTGHLCTTACDLSFTSQTFIWHLGVTLEYKLADQSFQWLDE